MAAIKFNKNIKNKLPEVCYGCVHNVACPVISLIPECPCKFCLIKSLCSRECGEFENLKLRIFKQFIRAYQEAKDYAERNRKIIEEGCENPWQKLEEHLKGWEDE